MRVNPGAIVKLPDGRIGTVVYHGLDGWGIMWDEIRVDMDVLLSGNPLFGKKPEGYPYTVDAMLREPYPAAVKDGLECVGKDFEVIDDLAWEEYQKREGGKQ